MTLIRSRIWSLRTRRVSAANCPVARALASAPTFFTGAHIVAGEEGTEIATDDLLGTVGVHALGTAFQLVTMPSRSSKQMA